MSKRRKPGEIVRRRAGSCFLDDAEPAIVRLTDESDDELHDNTYPCPLCDDPQCVEWANVESVSGNGWLYRLSECKMEDASIEDQNRWRRGG